MTDFASDVAAALRDVGVVATVRMSRAQRTLVAVRRNRQPIEIAVAPSLALAGHDDAVAAVVAFVMRHPDAAQRMRSITPAPRAVASPSRTVVPHVGRHHDLGAIAALEHAAHFPGIEPVPVYWSAARAGRAMRSIRLGAWDPGAGCIHVHGRLDHPLVPEWYLGFVVYHEYLHRVLDRRDRSRHSRSHSRAFRERERAHPHGPAAMAWQAEWLSRILSAEWGSDFP